MAHIQKRYILLKTNNLPATINEIKRNNMQNKATKELINGWDIRY